MSLQEEKNEKIRYNVAVILMLILISFISVTLNSKNSFIYAMNDSQDIQQFVTAVRCMARGDVLYRDIYEVKGPILYFLYYMGMYIFGNPFRGIYVIEILLFFVYMMLIYKIASLYLDGEASRLAAAAITAFFSTSTITMYGGGQCEELLFPVVGAALYISIKYIKEAYPQRIKVYQAITIGMLFAVTFWTKYICAGLFLGLVVYIIVLQIKDKSVRNLILYAVWFVTGMAVVTTGVLIYFIRYNAVDSLIDAYFLNMMTSYRDSAWLNLGTLEELVDLMAVNAFVVMGIADAILQYMQDRNGAYDKILIIVLAFFEALGVTCGRIHNYSPEIMQIFSIFGAIAIIRVIEIHKYRIMNVIKRCVDMILNYAHIGTETFRIIFLTVMLVCAIYMLPYGDGTTVYGSFLMVIIYVCVCTIVSHVVEKRYKGQPRKIYVIRYMSILVILFISCFLGDAFIMGALYTLIICMAVDVYRYRKTMVPYVKAAITEKKIHVYKRLGTNTGMLVVMAALMVAASPVVPTSALTIEDYPQYKISSYINASGVQNPIIVNDGILETGVYYMTSTYPPTKYMSDYNFISNADSGYISDGIAEFIVTKGKRKYTGYTCVYSGDIDYVTEGATTTFSLFVRDDIIDEYDLKVQD